MDKNEFAVDLNLIMQEVRKDIEPIIKEDRQTSRFIKRVMIDYRLTLYFLLKWIDKNLKPKSVLYPGSGFDRIPKIALGKEKVVHTSLENKENSGQEYFDSLGDGIKVTADNRDLPFKSCEFQLILLLDSAFDIIGKQRDEILRVLDYRGVIIFARNIFQDDLEKDRIGHYKKSNILEKINLPFKKWIKGESETEFFVFKKQN